MMMPAQTPPIQQQVPTQQQPQQQPQPQMQPQMQQQQQQMQQQQQQVHMPMPANAHQTPPLAPTAPPEAAKGRTRLQNKGLTNKPAARAEASSDVYSPPAATVSPPVAASARVPAEPEAEEAQKAEEDDKEPKAMTWAARLKAKTE